MLSDLVDMRKAVETSISPAINLPRAPACSAVSGAAIDKGLEASQASNPLFAKAYQLSKAPVAQ